MSLTIPTDPLPLRIDATGVPRVADTRSPLDTVICAYCLGRSPEEIVESFKTLALADVRTLIGRYPRHRELVDEYPAAERAHRTYIS